MYNETFFITMMNLSLILFNTERGSRDEWSFMLGGEEDKMKEITDDLLALFQYGSTEGI